MFYWPDSTKELTPKTFGELLGINPKLLQKQTFYFCAKYTTAKECFGQRIGDNQENDDDETGMKQEFYDLFDKLVGKTFQEMQFGHYKGMSTKPVFVVGKPFPNYVAGIFTVAIET